MATQATLIPAHPSLTEQIRSLYLQAERFPTTILGLMMRIAVGMIFLNAGLAKIASWDITLALFQDEYMVPLLPSALAAYLATAAELGCSALLFAGFATRLAALPLFGMTLVIQTFVYPQSWVEHLTWASMLLFLISRGPGMLSLDHLVRRWLEQRWGY
jgi:putative oxidoreductase